MPERIQRRRSRGWRMPAGAVYVGRPTIWGNPTGCQRPHWCKLAPCACCEQGDFCCVLAYREWLTSGIEGRGASTGLFVFALDALDGYPRRDEVVRRLPELRGRDLACWCPLDAPCHADVLLELANAPAPIRSAGRTTEPEGAGNA